MKLKKYIVYVKNKIVIMTSNKLLAKKYASAYDGAEIGSTDWIEEWSYPDLSTVIAKKIDNCKRKFQT